MWRLTLWFQNHYHPKSFKLGDYVLWFQRVQSFSSKFKCHWFGPYHVQDCLPNNTIFLVNKDKFDLSPLLVNVNKLKPYFPYDNNTKGLVLKFKRGKKEGIIEAHESSE